MDSAPGFLYNHDVTKVERVPVDDLHLWPGNPRKGNKRLIRESLQQFGQTRPIHARREGSVVMYGNNTLECMRELGFTHADVIYHDVDEATGRRMALIDNRTTDYSIYDDELIAGMLLQLDGDYAGTGWTSDEAEKYFELLRETEQGGYWELEDEDGYDDAVVEIEHVSSTGAAYAENPLAEQQRAERQSHQVTHNLAGTRELVLVYPEHEHEEVVHMLYLLKKAWGPDMRAPQAVHRLLKEAVDALG